MQPVDLQQRLRAWMSAHPGVFAAADMHDGVRLTETATGKTLVLEAASITTIEARANTLTGRDYLVLGRVHGPPVGLADAGFVFGLDTRNTGPLPAAPPVLGFVDFRRLQAHLRHLAGDPARKHEALDVLRILIAACDGARAAGLDTAVEEGELEAVLRQLEAGA